jgi:hypothetical protein
MVLAEATSLELLWAGTSTEGSAQADNSAGDHWEPLSSSWLRGVAKPGPSLLQPRRRTVSMTVLRSRKT